MGIGKGRPNFRKTRSHGFAARVPGATNGRACRSFEDTILCHERHEFIDIVAIPREAWGVGMSDKVIRTGLCPGGAERMKRLMRPMERGRVDPLPVTTPRVALEKGRELSR